MNMLLIDFTFPTDSNGERTTLSKIWRPETWNKFILHPLHGETVAAHFKREGITARIEGDGKLHILIPSTREELPQWKRDLARLLEGNNFITINAGALKMKSDAP